MILTNKTLRQLPLFAVVAFTFILTSCSDDTTGTNTEEESQLETYTLTDIIAGSQNSPAITYYSLRENMIVEDADSASTQWDVAFSRTSVYTNSGSSGPGNGGAIVLDQPFEATARAPSEGYAIDTSATNPAIPTGSDNGWYHYNPSTHIVTPIEGKTIVIRTADGEQYAKIKILNYYKGNPDLSSDEFNNNPDDYPAGYYTLEYAIQLNGSRKLQ